MTAITSEVLKAIDDAGHARVEDPDTRESYVVLKAAVFDRMRSLSSPMSGIPTRWP